MGEDNWLASVKANWQKYYRKLSLSQIIWISFTLTAFTATLLIGLSYYGRFSGQVQQTIREENQSLIEQVSNNCTTYIRNMMKVSDSLNYSVIKKTDLAEGSLSESFQLLYDTNKENIESIALFSMSGELLEAAPAAKLRDGVDIKKQEWYSLAVGSRENVHFASPTVENLFATRSTEYTWVVPMSRVVQVTRNSHVQSGILVINLRYSGLQDVLSNVLLGENAYIYLTDSGGEILYHPMKQLISGGQVEENKYTTAGLGDGNYVDTLGGQKRDIAIKTVGYTGWKIVGVIPQGSVTLSTFKSNLFVVFLMLFFLTALVVINSYISKRVSYPILRLEQSVKGLEEGNWNIPIQASGFYEVRHLGLAISNMALHIKKLMRDIVKEHEEKRKSELTALQNQINPHFLYNTLDIIVWMIENERKTEAVRVVTALARFFRISLSRGKNIITVADEIEHVRNYLMIQEMRFKNRFHYTFNVDRDVEELGTIKLILQPLVENSIYHAMEFMDGDGEIEIKGWKENDNVKLLIRDNGCGMTEEEVNHLLYGEPVVSPKGSGVGVRNVQDRIQLLFGEEYGLSIKSEPDEGTDVLVTIPAVAYSDLVKRGLE